MTETYYTTRIRHHPIIYTTIADCWGDFVDRWCGEETFIQLFGDYNSADGGIDCCYKLLLTSRSDASDIGISIWSNKLTFWESIKSACRALFFRKVREDVLNLDARTALCLVEWIVEQIRAKEEKDKKAGPG